MPRKTFLNGLRVDTSKRSNKFAFFALLAFWLGLPAMHNIAYTDPAFSPSLPFRIYALVAFFGPLAGAAYQFFAWIIESVLRVVRRNKKL
jgi:hypothetical protein